MAKSGKRPMDWIAILAAVGAGVTTWVITHRQREQDSAAAQGQADQTAIGQLQAVTSLLPWLTDDNPNKRERALIILKHFKYPDLARDLSQDIAPGALPALGGIALSDQEKSRVSFVIRAAQDSLQKAVVMIHWPGDEKTVGFFVTDGTIASPPPRGGVKGDPQIEFSDGDTVRCHQESVRLVGQGVEAIALLSPVRGSQHVVQFLRAQPDAGIGVIVPPRVNPKGDSRPRVIQFLGLSHDRNRVDFVETFGGEGTPLDRLSGSPIVNDDGKVVAIQWATDGDRSLAYPSVNFAARLSMQGGLELR